MLGPTPFMYGGGYNSLRKYQYGGARLPVYHGERYQYGDGIGDIFRGIGRFLLPILSPIFSKGIGSFVSNTASGLSSGQSLGEAAQSAIKPTAIDTVNAAGERIVRRIQTGQGRRRKRKSTSSVQVGGKRRRKSKKKKRTTKKTRKVKRRKRSSKVYKGSGRRKRNKKHSGLKKLNSGLRRYLEQHHKQKHSLNF